MAKSKRKNAPSKKQRESVIMKSLGLTDERQRHGDVIQRVPGDNAGQTVARNETQSLLDRYRARNELTQRQYDAGVALYQLWYKAGRGANITGSYNQTIPSDGNMSEDQALAWTRFNEHIQKLGIRLSGIVVAVCLHDQPASDYAQVCLSGKRDGIAVLRVALDALADIYRM